MKENLGPRAWLAMLVFIWIALVYLIIAFADITAATFVGKTQELEELRVQPGGSRGASTMYLILAVVMGLMQRKWDPPLWLMTILFVPATLSGGVARDADLGPPVLADDLGRHHHGVLLRRLGPPDLDAPPAARVSRRFILYLALAIGPRRHPLRWVRRRGSPS